MYTILLACFVAFTAAARLDNTYLPPQGAHGSGGSGLSAPFGGSSGGAGGSGGSGRSGEASAKIIHFDNDNDGLGSYSYKYETENRIAAQEDGKLKNAGSDSESLTAQGSYSYTAPDGSVITIKYIADENGFQPVGDHLPTSPPIPEEILKSLEQNAAEEAAGSRYQGGSGGSGQQSFNPETGYNY